MTVRDDLGKAFEASELQQFQGRGGKTYDYIEDETVMDRLDDALGVGAWSVTVEPISVADGIVKVRLEAIVDGKGVIFEDFGYANNTDGEALKEAVSDGIRRCGRYLGIARDLYRKHSTSPTGNGRSSRPSVTAGRAEPPPSVRPSSQPEFAPNEWDDARIASSGAKCELHGVDWKGEPGDYYHRLDGGGYCRPEGQPRRLAGARR